VIDVDALIRWWRTRPLVLRDLNKRGYGAVLLERGHLRGKQTCHSNALIHRGHYYDDVDMMIVLKYCSEVLASIH
jgi:glycerol-3-phosphate dehydrogenase